MSEHSPEQGAVEMVTRRWLAQCVVGLNLCPFARKELVNDRIRFVVSRANNEEALLLDLSDELQLLEQRSDIETTLLIHPHALVAFEDYNEFLDVVDGLLLQLDLEGVFQVASFHPQYQFAGTQPDDSENFTNRSPFPMLHLLREASVEKAIQAYPDTESIPERNVQLMNEMGRARLSALLASCFTDSPESSHPASEWPALAPDSSPGRS